MPRRPSRPPPDDMLSDAGTLPEDAYLLIVTSHLTLAIEEKDLSFRAVARRAGISPTTLKNIIWGEVYPDLRTIARLEAALNRSLLPGFVERQRAWRRGESIADV